MALTAGLHPDTVEKLVVTLKYDTLGKIAYAMSYQPGQGDEAPWVAWAETILGAGPPEDQLAALRQLHHECVAT
eukprot:6489576-Amphidinium_carterae.1